jgi:hypothetical protein
MLADVARARASDPEDLALRRWLVAHAIEGVQPARGGALADRLREHAADLGIPAAFPPLHDRTDG